MGCVCVRFEVSWLLDLFCEKVVRCCERVDCQVTCMKEGRKEGRKVRSSRGGNLPFESKVCSCFLKKKKTRSRSGNL